MLVRLQKIIADRGFCSRRKAEELILDNKVYVDNQLVNTLGNKYEEDQVVIKIGDKVLKPLTAKKFYYLLLNKPIGYITTLSDDRERKTVKDLIPSKYGRLFPVGRLDINTSGALIMTNDGDFANLVTHPSSSLGKVYQVTVKGILTSLDVKKLENGIMLEDGLTCPSKVNVLFTSTDVSIFNIEIHEGRNRQVRRMCEAIYKDVKYLKRIKIGPINLGDLPKGEFREIDLKTIDTIKKQCLYNKNHNTYKK